MLIPDGAFSCPVIFTMPIWEELAVETAAICDMLAMAAAAAGFMPGLKGKDDRGEPCCSWWREDPCCCCWCC